VDTLPSSSYTFGKLLHGFAFHEQAGSYFIWFHEIDNRRLIQTMSTEKEEKDDLLLGERLRSVRRQRNLNQQQVGEILEISKDYVSRIEKGERQPSPHLLKAINRWIENAATLNAPPNETPEEKLVRTYGRNPVTSSVSIPFKNEMADIKKSTDIIDESFNMRDMVAMTMDVLNSDTVYKPALASNIRAFHKAVVMEGEMNKLAEDVSEIKRQNKELNENIKMMMEALKASGITIPEKREQKTG